MRWSRALKTKRSAEPAGCRRTFTRTPPARLVFWLFAICLTSILLPFHSLRVAGANPEKHLAVFSVAANYSLPLVQHDGRDYVGLLELLEPLGKVSAKFDGSHWKIHYNNIDGDFQTSKSRAKVMGREADLGGKFFLENNRGLVPVAALASLLPRFLGGPVSLHEDSDRLFIGNAGTHFTASLAAENPAKLVFQFSAGVNPTVATEPGTLRMTFPRDPVVGPASPTLTFGSKTIPSATFSEANGSATITVNASTPVMATFSADQRTITVAPVSAQKSASASGAGTSANATPGQTLTAATASTPPAIPRRYFAVVDASHGGDDIGEALGPGLLEKDVTVALAHSLRQELESRGITTLVLRDSDANLSPDQRAIFANADRAAIYIALHATSSGRGVRVYTALLPWGEDDRGPFRSWTTAQHASLPLSQSTATAVIGELQKRQVPVRQLMAPLRPLNNITGPAIAVEVSPQSADVSQLMAPDYQQLVMSAVATAIAAAKDQLAAQ